MICEFLIVTYNQMHIAVNKLHRFELNESFILKETIYSSETIQFNYFSNS